MGIVKEPLFISGYTPDKVPLLAGIFRMKDEVGFPVDMSYEECKHQGLCPDWFEYLCDAGRQGDWKYDAAEQEMRMLVGDVIADEIVQRFKVVGALEMRAGDTFPSVCQRLWQRKQVNTPAVA